MLVAVCALFLPAVRPGLAAQEPAAQARPLPTLERIADVRRDADDDGLPDRLSDTVRVRGVALAATGDLHFDQFDLPIHDGSAGIFLFHPDVGREVAQGDTLEVVGTVSDYRARAQINVLEYRVVGHGTPLGPVVLDAIPADYETLEGQLISFAARVVGAGRNSGGPFLVVVPDLAPDRPITVFARTASRAAQAFQGIVPQDRVTVVGVVGQYDAAAPFHDGYQIHPREPADVRVVGLRHTTLRTALLVVGALLLGALLWSFTLRREVRRQTESARASEEEVRTLMERGPGAILLLRDATVLYANEAAQALFSLSPQGGGGLGEALDARSTAALLAAAASDSSQGWAGRLTRADGASLEVEVLAAGVTYDGLPARQVWLLDVGDRNRALREREAMEEQVREARRLESVMFLAGGLAHRYNNLLVAVLGNAGLLKEGADLSDEDRALVEDVEAAAEEAAALTRRLVTLAGKAGLQRRTVPVQDLLERIRTRLVTSVWPTLGMWDAACPGEVNVDEDQIREALEAVLANAAEAVDHDMASVEVEARIVDHDGAAGPSRLWLPAGRYLRVRVEDHGAGLAEDVLTRAFDPMFTTKGLGRGLGLSTARGIMEAHGGGAGIHSAPDQGTRVDLFLPLA